MIGDWVEAIIRDTWFFHERLREREAIANRAIAEHQWHQRMAELTAEIEAHRHLLPCPYKRP